MTSLDVLIVLVMAAIALGAASSIKSRRSFEWDNHFAPPGNFGMEDNFGGEFKNVKSNLECIGSCKTPKDCCKGYKCKSILPGSKFGYCAKQCLPVGSGEDCRRCMACTDGLVCTILLSGQYTCLPRPKTIPPKNL